VASLRDPNSAHGALDLIWSEAAGHDDQLNAAANAEAEKPTGRSRGSERYQAKSGHAGEITVKGPDRTGVIGGQRSDQEVAKTKSVTARGPRRHPFFDTRPRRGLSFFLAPERISMRTGAGNATSSRSNRSESLATTGSRPRKKLIQTDVSTAITVTYGAPSSPFARPIPPEAAAASD